MYCSTMCALSCPRRSHSFVAAPPPGTGNLGNMLVRNTIGGPSSVDYSQAKVPGGGGFDESLIELEDYELWIRLCLAGASFQYIPRTLSIYAADSRRESRTASRELDLSAWSEIHQKHEDCTARCHGANVVCTKHTFQRTEVTEA